MNPSTAAVVSHTDAWIGFFGSILGGIIGGIVTLFGIYFTFRHERSKERELRYRFYEPFDYALESLLTGLKIVSDDIRSGDTPSNSKGFIETNKIEFLKSISNEKNIGILQQSDPFLYEMYRARCDFFIGDIDSLIDMSETGSKEEFLSELKLRIKHIEKMRDELLKRAKPNRQSKRGE